MRKKYLTIGLVAIFLASCVIQFGRNNKPKEEHQSMISHLTDSEIFISGCGQKQLEYLENMLGEESSKLSSEKIFEKIFSMAPDFFENLPRCTGS